MKLWQIVPWMLLAGCASLPRESGLSDVRQEVAARTGQAVVLSSEGDAPAPAAQPDAPLTLDEAVRLALRDNRRLQAALTELDEARADLVEARTPENPELGAAVRFAEHEDEDANLELEAEQDLGSILLAPARSRVARTRMDRAQRTAAVEALELVAEVKEAYHELQGTQQLLELRRTVLEAAEISHDAARRLYEAGNIPELRLHGEQAQLEQARLGLIRAEAELRELRERLGALLGLPRAARWTLAEGLRELPSADPEAGALEASALSGSLELEAARLAVEAAESARRLARAEGWLPGLAVGVSAEREPDGEWLVGPAAALSLPLLDRGRAETLRAEAALRRTQHEEAALRTELLASVGTAHARLEAARRRAEHYRTVILPLRERIVAETQLLYNAMQIGLFELLAARQEQIDAAAEYIEALRDYWVARAALERAIGGRLPQPAATPAEAEPPADPEPPAAAAPSETHEHHHP